MFEAGCQLRVTQMPGRQFGAGGGALAHVEMHQRVGRRVLHFRAQAVQQVTRQGRGSLAHALHRQRRDFVDGIKPAQGGIKLQAINHCGTFRQ